MLKEKREPVRSEQHGTFLVRIATAKTRSSFAFQVTNFPHPRSHNTKGNESHGGQTYAEPRTNGTVSLNPNRGIDRRVVRSMATDVE